MNVLHKSTFFKAPTGVMKHGFNTLKFGKVYHTSAFVIFFLVCLFISNFMLEIFLAVLIVSLVHCWIYFLQLMFLGTMALSIYLAPTK